MFQCSSTSTRRRRDFFECLDVHLRGGPPTRRGARARVRPRRTTGARPATAASESAVRSRAHARGKARLCLSSGSNRSASAVSEMPIRRDAVVAQTVAKHVLELLLQLAIEVDQQIATRDEMQLRERRIAQHAVRREHDAIADFARHAIMVALGTKIALEPRFGDIGGDRRRIDAVARRGERALIDVGSEDHDLGGQSRRLISSRNRSRGCMPPRPSRSRVPSADRLVAGARDPRAARRPERACASQPAGRGKTSSPR